MALTNSQSLIWTGQQLHPGVPLYNMVLTFDIRGHLDPVHFENAFAAVVRRSDALRTVVDDVGGEPLQRVLAPGAAALEHIDLSGSADSAATVRAWLAARSVRPFVLDQSLYDAALIRLPHDCWLWYLNQHHLVTDGWSTALVYRRVSDYYARSLAGELATAPSLPLFAAYVEHERRYRSSASHRRVREHWSDERRAAITPIRLYGRRPAVETTATDRWVQELGGERSRALRAAAQARAGSMLTGHTTLFNFFMTALFAWLHRISGQRNLAIGTPSHNRATTAFKETIGLFIEIFPFRVDLGDDETFESLLAKVQAETGSFLRYAQPGTSTSSANRSVSVLLNYIHASFPSFHGLPVRSTWVHPGHGDSAHHLRLQIQDFDETGNFQLHFDFNRDLCTERERELAAPEYLSLLDVLIHNPGQRVRDAGLGFALDATPAVPPDAARGAAVTVVELFEAQSARTPDAVALAAGCRELTYAQVERCVAQLASHLRRVGVGPETCVGLDAERSIEVVIGVLAVLKAGGAYVPVAPDEPPARILAQLQDAGVRIVLAGPVKNSLSGWYDGLTIDLAGVVAAGLPAGPRDIAGDPRGAGPADTSRPVGPGPGDAAYVLYTSGSTGRPKGVVIEHGALASYLQWARDHYAQGAPLDFPLFTSLCFDLTVTSLFLPLITGGRVVVYQEDDGGVPALLRVLGEDRVDAIKLTPSHLSLARRMGARGSRVRVVILGGEALAAEQARAAAALFPCAGIYNEYGPTEAAVGCMIHRFDPARDLGPSVPIGVAAARARIDLVDAHGNPVPAGVAGEMLVSGPGLARGYLNQPDLTAQRFVTSPLDGKSRSYRTGDLARRRVDGVLEYLGRLDEQVKVRGARIELGEVEAGLLAHPAIDACVVDAVRFSSDSDHDADARHCARCGLPSNYPGATYDEEGVCHLCRGFDRYREKVRPYFRTLEDLWALFAAARARHDGRYDCVLLLSGGKDSTYALCRLVDMGVRVLAFTLDNGYLSAQAMDNIRRVTAALGVPHVFGTTPAMNAIFVDSLRRYSNVCNGCFKTIYTLGARLAREQGIPIVVTGLSRGQFFETRLTEELFLDESLEVDRIDRIILEARMAYHRVDDAVARLLDTSEFRDDAVFEELQFVDFYRYCDVGLDELLDYLTDRVPWIRPADTGRSTNCLINAVGIYVHTAERGYHNYAFPYSWDVRVGHKTRDEALAELNDDIDAAEVERILNEIGFDRPLADADSSEIRLVAYYVANSPVTASDLRAHLSRMLPAYMLPTHFTRLERLPLTSRGKIDRAALPRPDGRRPLLAASYVAPRNPLEARIASVWAEVLKVQAPGIHDAFLDLGGNSLLAIQIISRVNQAFGVELPLRSAFEASTVAALAGLVHEALLSEIEAMSEDDARSLAGDGP